MPQEQHCTCRAASWKSNEQLLACTLHETGLLLISWRQHWRLMWIRSKANIMTFLILMPAMLNNCCELLWAAGHRQLCEACCQKDFASYHTITSP